MRVASLIFAFSLMLGFTSCDNEPKPANPDLLFSHCVDDVDPYVDLYEDLLDKMESGKEYKYLVLHCTASAPQFRFTKESLLRFFREERGWSRPGYRDFIDKEGKLHNLRPYDGDGILQPDEITYGAKGFNSVSIHVAYDGGIDSHLSPKDTRTEAQKAALGAYVGIIKTIYPNIIVVGHRDLPGVQKACPSFDVIAEYQGQEIDLVNIFPDSVLGQMLIHW